MAVNGPTYSNYLTYSSAEADYWSNVTVASGTAEYSTAPNALQGSLCQVTWGRAEATGIREDVALVDLHMGVYGGVSGTWAVLNASDKSNVEAALDTWWGGLKLARAAHWSLTGYIWRDYGADYPKGKTGLSKPGPINRQTTRSVPGTSAANQYHADQVAQTTTFKTASRKHWGRVYMPPVDPSKYTQYSRISSTSVDSDAQYWNALMDTLSNLSRAVHIVVWSTKHCGQFAVSTMKIDDVPDVIRRRRAKTKTYEKSYGLP